MYAELTIFGRTLRVSYYRLVVDLEEELAEDEEDEPAGPPIHADSPLVVQATSPGFRLLGLGYVEQDY